MQNATQVCRSARVPLVCSASLTLLHSLTYATSPTCTASLTCSPLATATLRSLPIPQP